MARTVYPARSRLKRSNCTSASLLPLFLRLKNLPTVSIFRPFVEYVGVMSYWLSEAEVLSRGAVFVDKILKGAKAANLPVEQPSDARPGCAPQQDLPVAHDPFGDHRLQTSATRSKRPPVSRTSDVNVRSKVGERNAPSA